MIFAAFTNYIFSQNNEGQFHGNFQTDFQYYTEDTIIGASVPDEIIGLNSYANFTYTKGDFSAGLRFEGYMPPLEGFEPRYEGVGIPYKYLQYNADQIDITVGSFYEQYGNGLVLRAYEERNLGYDNAFEGIKVKYSPLKGVYLKGLFARQRTFWDIGDGIVRAIDGEIMLNEAIKKFNESKTIILVGGSAVSKYQKDFDPIYKLPENVAAFAGRINITRGKINLYGEYAYKINDPSEDNKQIYKPGEALIVNASYSQKGLGILVSAKRVDNMSFRSDREATLSNLSINYIPDITKAHTYGLAAMYPYATQLTGEMGLQAEINYKFKKGSLLGGKYGTGLSLNISSVKDIAKKAINDTTEIGESGTLGYSSDFLAIGDEMFYQDFNVEINKKFSKKVKMILLYQSLKYNNDVIHGAGDWHGKIFADVFVADVTYKFTSKKAIRFEFQELMTKDQYGDWAYGLIEFSIPHWFFTVLDQYNYGNPDKTLQVHYPKVAIGYTKGTNSIQIGYGKQRQGVMCIGGVCRTVPASNGLTLTITSSF